MKIIADMHTHTIASTHAYGTVNEMVRQAADIGLYAIGITDHGPAMPGCPREWYFNNFAAIPSTYLGVRVLMGAEANITDFDGNLDLPKENLDRLEWIVASLHLPTLDMSIIKPTIETCTALYLNAAENPYINVIGHSDSPFFAYDYEKVIPVFAEKGKLVEINDATFKRKRDCVENCIRIAKICKKVGAPVIVNTDAHFMTDLGKAEGSLRMLEEINFPEELVVNSPVERFEKYLTEHNLPLRQL